MYKPIHHHHIFRNLLKLAPNLLELKAEETLISIGKGEIMDLNLHVLAKEKGCMLIALTNYDKNNKGFMIPDPCMEIRLFMKDEIAEAMTFENYARRRDEDRDRRYRVYTYDDSSKGEICTSIDLKKYLNYFLYTWLRNCLKDGHKLKQKEI